MRQQMKQVTTLHKTPESGAAYSPPSNHLPRLGRCASGVLKPVISGIAAKFNLQVKFGAVLSCNWLGAKTAPKRSKHLHTKTGASPFI
jgi:hypothetical protein